MLTFLIVLASSYSQATDYQQCMPYESFKHELELGHAEAARAELAKVCPQGTGAKCSDLYACYPREYAIVAQLHIPQSFKVLEQAQFDIGQRNLMTNSHKKGNTSLEDLAESCDAEGLFLLRVAGAGKTLSETEERSVQVELKHRYKEITNQCLLRGPGFFAHCLERDANFKPTEEETALMDTHRADRSRMANKCLRSQQVMKLSDQDLRGLVEGDNLDETHSFLSNLGFDDACQDAASRDDLISTFSRITSTRQKLETPTEESRRHVHCYQKANISEGSLSATSQIDRIIHALIQMKNDQAGIFSSYYQRTSLAKDPSVSVQFRVR